MIGIKKGATRRLHAVTAALVCLTPWTTAMYTAPNHGAPTYEDPQYGTQYPPTRLHSAYPTLHATSPGYDHPPRHDSPYPPPQYDDHTT